MRKFRRQTALFWAGIISLSLLAGCGRYGVKEKQAGVDTKGENPAADTENAEKRMGRYLEAIWRIALREQSEAVRSVDVAELLGVSKASVNKALSTLKENGYVEQHRYGRVTLTNDGAAYARRLWRSHRALRTFLETELGVDPQVADEEACRMEHALSDDTMNRWVHYLEKAGIAVDTV